MAYKISLLVKKHRRYFVIGFIAAFVVFCFLPVYFDPYSSLLITYFNRIISLFYAIINFEERKQFPGFYTGLFFVITISVMIVTQIALLVVSLFKNNKALTAITALPVTVVLVYTVVLITFDELYLFIGFYAMLLFLLAYVAFIYFSFATIKEKRKPIKPPKQKQLTDKERIAQLEEEVKALKDKVDQ